MAEPAVRNLAIYRGDDYSHVITFTDDDVDLPEPLILTGYTFKAQIRERPEYGKNILATFVIDTTQLAEGKIVLHLSKTATDIPSGYWDLEVDNGSTVHTWLKGKVTMTGDVTQGITA